MPLVSPPVYSLGRSHWCDQLELALNTTLQADVTRGFLWLASIHFICTPGDLSTLIKLALAFLESNYADLTPRIVRRESVVLSAPNGDCPHHWLEVSCDGTSMITMNWYMDVAAPDDADWWIKWAFERWLGAKCWTDSFPSKEKSAVCSLTSRGLRFSDSPGWAEEPADTQRPMVITPLDGGGPPKWQCRRPWLLLVLKNR